MANGKLTQLITENVSWKHQLKELEDENIHSKMTLANLLKGGRQPEEQLEELENFQTRFLKMDEHIILLRHEIREQLYTLEQAAHVHRFSLHKIAEQQNRLGIRFIIIQESADKLTREFNDYLHAIQLLI